MKFVYMSGHTINNLIFGTIREVLVLIKLSSSEGSG